MTLTCQYRHGIGSQLYKCPGLEDLWINNLQGRNIQACGFRKLHIFWCTTSLKASRYCIACVLSHCSHVWLFVTPWTVTCQAPLFMGFPRQDHWSGLPFLSPGDLPHQEIEPGFLALQMDSLPSKRPRKSRPLEYWFSVINLNMTPRKSHCSCVERACFNFPEWIYMESIMVIQLLKKSNIFIKSLL